MANRLPCTYKRLTDKLWCRVRRCASQTFFGSWNSIWRNPDLQSFAHQSFRAKTQSKEVIFFRDFVYYFRNCPPPHPTLHTFLMEGRVHSDESGRWAARQSGSPVQGRMMAWIARKTPCTESGPIFLNLPIYCPSSALHSKAWHI